MSKIRLAQYAGHIFIVRTAMTPTQVQTVQDSFQRIAANSTRASGLFYSELFRLAPDLRQLFPPDMVQHERKFMLMLAAIVKALDKVETVSQDVVDLGRRHMSYDVQEEHFSVLNEAFLAMLNQLLGADCRPEIEDAWAAAFDMMARIMQDSADLPLTAEGFFGGIIRGVIASQYGLAIAAAVGKRGKAPISRKVERGEIVRLQ